MDTAAPIGLVLTGRQRQVYRLLLASLLGRQRFPTWRELLRALGLDPACNLEAVNGHLKALERQGLLTRAPRGRIQLTGLRLEAMFEDSETGARARAAWEG